MEGTESEPTPRPGLGRGYLLEFLAPGLVHELGNSLFSIRGAAHMLELDGEDGAKAQRLLLDGYDKATRSLDILRELSADAVGAKPCPLSVAVRRVLELARVPLRDRGHRAVLDPDPSPDRVVVDGTIATPALLTCIVALSNIARGKHAEIHISREEAQSGTAVLHLRVEPQDREHAIVVDHASIAALIGRDVGSHTGAEVDAPGRELRLRLRYSL